MLRFDPKNIDHIEDIEKIFLDLKDQTNNLQSNKIGYKGMKTSVGGSGRHYYPRPTPPDILFEEIAQHNQRFFQGSEIYCWEIDGKSDFLIMNTIHEMMIYATACKNRNNDDKKCALMIISGFTGILRGWWDNYLNESQKNEVLNAVKTEVDQNNQPVVVSDAVYTLIHAIIYHFMGSVSNNDESQRYML